MKTFTRLFIVALVLFWSCSDDEDSNILTRISFTKDSGTLSEASSDGFEVEVALFENVTAGVTFDVEISGPGVYGTDYTTTPDGSSGSFSVTIPMGSNIGSFTVNSIDNTNFNDDLDITFTLANAPEGFILGTDVEFQLTLEDDETNAEEDPATFSSIGDITLAGGEGAAEISAFDPSTGYLFVVNNSTSSVIDVVDLSNPSSPTYLQSIDATAFGDGVNSVAVKNGLLAAAIEAEDSQANGKVVIFTTADLNAAPTVVDAGALPDMVTFSPNGTYIVVANEGEPNDAYDNDPEGTVTVIDVNANFAASTLTFTGFNDDEAALETEGFRVFGPNATLAQDIEPEFITVSDDSKSAFVALQENNGIAKIDLATKTITDIFPLGFKDYSIAGNEIDASDEDGDAVVFAARPAFGMYQPDAIAYFEIDGTEYIISANEGDAREYDGFEEEARVKDITLDPTVFPNAAELQAEDNLGRLIITTTIGDTDGDGDFDELYSFGARSFSIWNAADGAQVFDSGNEIEVEINNAGLYADGRSDAKGVEPEGVAVGVIAGGKTLAFVGLERVDAVAVYDISNPSAPMFISILEVGDAPEGISFIPAMESPNGKSMLIVSSEDDGQVIIFQPERL